MVNSFAPGMFGVGEDRYIKVQRTTCEEHRYRQRSRGRPNADTSYRRTTRHRFDIAWSTDEAAIAYDRKTDGMYSLLTNDKTLTARQVLEAHKGQPAIERRFEQCKTVYEVAPVFLKNESRIEGLFLLYFLGLLVQGLIERELRRRMREHNIKEIPLYPEDRCSSRPTTEQVFRLFSHVQGQVLHYRHAPAEIFQPELTDLQKEVLRLLGVPLAAYRITDDR